MLLQSTPAQILEWIREKYRFFFRFMELLIIKIFMFLLVSGRFSSYRPWPH